MLTVSKLNTTRVLLCEDEDKVYHGLVETLSDVGGCDIDLIVRWGAVYRGVSPENVYNLKGKVKPFPFDYDLTAYDAILLDLDMPDVWGDAPQDLKDELRRFAGLEGLHVALRALQIDGSRRPPILIHSANIDTARESHDNLIKQLEDAKLLREWPKDENSFEYIREFVCSLIIAKQLGASIGLDRMAQLAQAAFGNHRILIVGETGTGKELMARHLHRLWMTINHSGEKAQDSRLHTVNCAGWSSGLARAELFGHTKDAFTGAVKPKLGVALHAEGFCDAPKASNHCEWLKNCFGHKNIGEPGRVDRSKSKGLNITLKPFAEKDGVVVPWGTLFLDEIGDLDPEVQPALLRFLNDGEVQPSGYNGVIRNVRPRIIAATNHPDAFAYAGVRLPERADRSGDPDAGRWGRMPFREDLFHRFEDVIYIPPLDIDEVRGFVDRVRDNLELSERIRVPFDPSAYEYLKTLVEARAMSGQRRQLDHLVRRATRSAQFAARIGERRCHIVDERMMKSCAGPLNVSPSEISNDGGEELAVNSGLGRPIWSHLAVRFGVTDTDGWLQLPDVTRQALKYYALVESDRSNVQIYDWDDLETQHELRVRLLALRQLERPKSWIGLDDAGDLFKFPEKYWQATDPGRFLANQLKVFGRIPKGTKIKSDEGRRLIQECLQERLRSEPSCSL